MKAASEAPARPAPEVPRPAVTGAAPSVPLSGPVDSAADDSLDGLHTAFKGLSVDEEIVKGPGKKKREREMDAEESGADKGVEPGRDPTLATPSSSSGTPFESAPGASDHHASPSPSTTPLPTPDTAATTSTPTTTPPMAETAAGTGFTGIPAPAHPAYGAASSTPTTTPPMAETAAGTGYTGMPAPAYPAYGAEPYAAEGDGFTGMPALAYPAYGVGLSATAPPPRTATASEHMAAASTPL